MPFDTDYQSNIRVGWAISQPEVALQFLSVGEPGVGCCCSACPCVLCNFPDDICVTISILIVRDFGDFATVLDTTWTGQAVVSKLPCLQYATWSTDFLPGGAPDVEGVPFFFAVALIQNCDDTDPSVPKLAQQVNLGGFAIGSAPYIFVLVDDDTRAEFATYNCSPFATDSGPLTDTLIDPPTSNTWTISVQIQFNEGPCP